MPGSAFKYRRQRPRPTQSVELTVVYSNRESGRQLKIASLEISSRQDVRCSEAGRVRFEESKEMPDASALLDRNLARALLLGRVARRILPFLLTPEMLEEISPNVCIVRPLQGSSTKAQQPDVVLMCGWLDAKLPHLRKYAEGYQKLFPAATLVILRFSSRQLLIRARQSRSLLEPAISQMHKHAIVGTPNAPGGPNILVHAWSNGGGIALTDHARFLRQLYPHQIPAIPAHTLILDSLPGKTTFSSLHNAFSVPFAKSSRVFVRWPVTLGIAAAFGLFKILNFITFGRMDVIQKQRQYLLDPALLGKSKDMLYIYSRSDPIIDFRFVEEHIAEARKAGNHVQTAVFSDSNHVAHMQNDKQKYWELVRKFWEASSTRQRSGL